MFFDCIMGERMDDLDKWVTHLSSKTSDEEISWLSEDKTKKALICSTCWLLQCKILPLWLILRYQCSITEGGLGRVVWAGMSYLDHCFDSYIYARHQIENEHGVCSRKIVKKFNNRWGHGYQSIPDWMLVCFETWTVNDNTTKQSMRSSPVGDWIHHFDLLCPVTLFPNLLSFQRQGKGNSNMICRSWCFLEFWTGADSSSPVRGVLSKAASGSESILNPRWELLLACPTGEHPTVSLLPWCRIELWRSWSNIS